MLFYVYKLPSTHSNSKEIIMPLTPTQSGQLNPSHSFFFGSNCVAGNAITVSSGSGIFIPYSALDSYKGSVSGDVRELLYSVIEKCHSGLTQVGINSTSYKVNSGRTTSILGETSVRRNYNINVDLNMLNTTYDVQEEN
jgi:hypothetical protein